jgi:hypothetical protein
MSYHRHHQSLPPEYFGHTVTPVDGLGLTFAEADGIAERAGRRLGAWPYRARVIPGRAGFGQAPYYPVVQPALRGLGGSGLFRADIFGKQTGALGDGLFRADIFGRRNDGLGNWIARLFGRGRRGLGGSGDGLGSVLAVL